jgi:sarcosine oxidase
MSRFDSIVLGLGAMGSAAACHLARRGNRVLGIDRYSPPHALGSTHGDTRITRLAIGEGGHYTPLALRSHELWRELERETGRTLLTCNGGLVISSAAKTSISHVENFFANTVAAARRFGIAHELLDAAAIRTRFPGFNVGDDEHGYFEPGAGFVRPEACVAAHLEIAGRRGATLRRDETVRGFAASGREVTVTTDRGEYRADRLIVTAGAWLPDLVGPEVARHFKVYRQTLFWFDVEGALSAYVPEHFPIFIWELQQRAQGIYGFPAIDGARGGLKIGAEHYERTTTADGIDRTVSQVETDAMYDRLVAPFLPGLGRRCVRSAVCLYTVTPDFGFVIDRHPASDRVLIASPCSGHGFKHSAAIGEALAEIVVDGASRLDLGSFRLDRFAA